MNQNKVFESWRNFLRNDPPADWKNGVYSFFRKDLAHT
jgi:hypothetical protein